MAASPMALVLPQLLVNWVSLGSLLRFHESLPYKGGYAQEGHKRCDRSSVRTLLVSSGHPSVLRFPSLLLEVVRRLLRNSENLFHIQIERTSA